jgi:hypothetical protein
MIYSMFQDMDHSFLYARQNTGLLWHSSNNKTLNARLLARCNHSRLNRQIWYRHPNSEAGNDEIQNVQSKSKHGFLFCGNYILKYW